MNGRYIGNNVPPVDPLDPGASPSALQASPSGVTRTIRLKTPFIAHPIHLLRQNEIQKKPPPKHSNNHVVLILPVPELKWNDLGGEKR